MRHFYTFIVVTLATLQIPSLKAQTITYTFPPESAMHEGTWLQWPHDFTYGEGFTERFEDAWVDMTRQLIKGEKVYIIAYNEDEKNRIEAVLTAAAVPLDMVEFYVHPNNDFWVRDNGPMFVYDNENNLKILDWGFDGWGNDAPYDLCDVIPIAVGDELGMDVIDLNAMVLEGGAFETDGNGTFIGTRSSIMGDDRNPDLSESDIENYLTVNTGITNFIWLDGYYGGEEDITDMHVDGFAKFRDSLTLVTMNEDDLYYWYLSEEDIAIVGDAKNKNGIPYNKVILPLTNKNVKTTDGINLGFKGSYVNYYEGNAVVMVPIYMDDNDTLALDIIEGIFPDKEVVGIDCRNMLFWGGMVHCVTQQQPAAIKTAITEIKKPVAVLDQNAPNPFNAATVISWNIEDSFSSAEIMITSQTGVIVSRIPITQTGKGETVLTSSLIANGAYQYSLIINGKNIATKKLIITKK